MSALRMKRVLGIKRNYVVIIKETGHVYAIIRKAKHGWAVYHEWFLVGYEDTLDAAFTSVDARYMNQGRRRTDQEEGNG